MGASAKPRDIPAEVIHAILSPCRPADLASAGLINRKFQAEADRLLYRSIGYRMHLKKMQSCLDTIAAVKSKAILVKSFFVYIHRPDTTGQSSAVVERLSAALPNMTALTNLILLIHEDISEEERISLVQALQRSTFSLTSFYTTSILDPDLRSFIPKQTSLRYLVFSHPDWTYEPSELSLYRTLIQNSENRLSLFALTRFGGWTDTITFFPAFSRDWSAAPIKQVLPSLFEDPWVICYFILYIDSLSDHEHLRQYVQSISDSFPGISNLDLYVRDHRIDKNTKELASAFSCLTALSELQVLYWGLEGSEISLSYPDASVDLARRWSAQCPTLSTIVFPDLSRCVSKEGLWSLDLSRRGLEED